MMLCFCFRQHFRQMYLKAIKKVTKMLFSHKTADVLVNQLCFLNTNNILIVS